MLLQTRPPAGPASPGRESLYPEQEFQEGSVRGRWDHYPPSCFSKGELEQLHKKMRAQRIPADRKVGNQGCTATSEQ